jgi:hypothetical protein
MFGHDLMPSVDWRRSRTRQVPRKLVPIIPTTCIPVKTRQILTAADGTQLPIPTALTEPLPPAKQRAIHIVALTPSRHEERASVRGLLQTLRSKRKSRHTVLTTGAEEIR